MLAWVMVQMLVAIDRQDAIMKLDIATLREMAEEHISSL